MHGQQNIKIKTAFCL